MGDVPLMIGIIVFWFIISITLTGMAQDSSIQQANFTGNTTTVIDVNTNFVNMSALPSESTTTPVTFMNMLGRLFTFRLSGIIDMPEFISSIISFLNYLIILILGILVFRQFSIGGGSG